MDLGESLSLWRALEETSSKLTGFVKRACEVLGLDPNVDVLVSLEYIYENPEYEPKICGYYDPAKKLIVVSLPCIMRKDLKDGLAETLAHELIHHCQYTNGSLCNVHLNTAQAERIYRSMPYKNRPHEIEAYAKQKDLAKILQGVEGFNEVANYVKRLAMSEVRLPPINEAIKAQVNNPLLEEIAKDIVNLAREDLLSVASNILNTQLCKIEDETARKRFEEEATSYLQKLKEDPVKTILEDIKRDVETFLEWDVEERRVKSLILDPAAEQPHCYLFLDNGITIGFDLKSTYLPLLPLLLKTKDQTLPLKKLGELSFKLTIEEILQGILRARDQEFELKILPREDMAKNLSNELCEDYTKPSDKKIDVNDFFALLSLSGLNIHSIKRQKFGETDCFIFTIVGPGDSERFEFIMPSDVRVEDVVTGVNESLKDLIEKLRHKDNFKNFIIRYFKKKYAYTCVYYKTLKVRGEITKKFKKI